MDSEGQEVVPTASQPLAALAAAWGFTEDEPLRLLHVQLVAALRAGQPARELWGNYLYYAIPQFDFPGPGVKNVKARAAVAIMRGLICLEAGETVSALSHLLLAETTARHHGRIAEERLLTAEIANHGSDAEQQQAMAYFHEDAQEGTDAATEYESALAIYGEAEGDDSITDAHRGLVNHRMAECHLGLLRLEQGEPDVLHLLIIVGLLSAADYRQGTPDLAKTQGLIAQLSQEPWWDATMAQLES